MLSATKHQNFFVLLKGNQRQSDYLVGKACKR